MTTDTDVRARVRSEDKEMAAAVLREMGLSISDLLRMAIVQTAKLKRLPFSNEPVPVRIDIDRMKESLASETITPPMGLSKDELDKFFLSHAE